MIKETTMKYDISVSDDGMLFIDLFQMENYWRDDYTNLFTVTVYHTEAIQDTYFHTDTIKHYYHKRWTKVFHI